MRHLFLLFALALILAACGNDKQAQLVGTWEETGTSEHSRTTYDANGTYSTTYDDGSTQKGKWHLDGNTLYTTEEGTTEELSEEIVSLDDEHLKTQISGFGLVIEMNFKRIE